MIENRKFAAAVLVCATFAALGQHSGTDSIVYPYPTALLLAAGMIALTILFLRAGR